MTNRPVGSTDRPIQHRDPVDAKIAAAVRTAWARTDAPATADLREAVLRIPLEHPRDVVTKCRLGGCCAACVSPGRRWPWLRPWGS